LYEKIIQYGHCIEYVGNGNYKIVDSAEVVNNEPVVHYHEGGKTYNWKDVKAIIQERLIRAKVNFSQDGKGTKIMQNLEELLTSIEENLDMFGPDTVFLSGYLSCNYKGSIESMPFVLAFGYSQSMENYFGANRKNSVMLVASIMYRDLSRSIDTDSKSFKIFE
jgi:hypothetical protein